MNMKRLAHYSQNFLRSPKLVRELIAKSTLTKNDLVYDIGAGSGVITSVLATHVKTVIAVEYEPRIIETLRQNVTKFSNVTVLHADYLKLTPPDQLYKIFANIPFHLSSPIIKSFVYATNSPEAAYLIVQKQFGQKLRSDQEGSFTAQLGMLVGPLYSVKILKQLQRADFWPNPAIDTVFIELLKRKTPLVPPERFAAYERFTVECFADPKKLAKLPLKVIGKAPGFPPSRLTLTQWLILFNSQTVY
jgi:16S rRNA A1518/A1519 N6-dimethyltransferase RsmA/KsgA/DIM1 with predicted DNA glycosylase/AP lyase activity